MDDLNERTESKPFLKQTRDTFLIMLPLVISFQQHFDAGKSGWYPLIGAVVAAAIYGGVKIKDRSLMSVVARQEMQYQTLERKQVDMGELREALGTLEPVCVQNVGD